MITQKTVSHGASLPSSTVNALDTASRTEARSRSFIAFTKRTHLFERRGNRARKVNAFGRPTLPRELLRHPVPSGQAQSNVVEGIGRPQPAMRNG